MFLPVNGGYPVASRTAAQASGGTSKGGKVRSHRGTGSPSQPVRSRKEGGSSKDPVPQDCFFGGPSMTLIKSLLLGSAAGLVAVSAAQAADLPTPKGPGAGDYAPMRSIRRRAAP